MTAVTDTQAASASRRRSLRGFTAVAALLTVGTLAACGNSSTKQAEAGTATTTTASAVKVVAPDKVGPFKVGRRTISLNDTAHGRKLDVDVWYPAAKDATGTPSRYSFLPTVYFDSKVALTEPPVATGEKFPMVIYSHGSGGLRYVASYFTETLASHGFVVVSADHTGNTATDGVLGSTVPRDQNAINRVGDVQFLITAMLAKNTTAGDAFNGTIDPERVGISGHSFGGFTAIAAQTGYSNPLGSFTGDKRIKAVAGMAPYTEIIDDATLAKLSVPTLIITGTKDITTPIPTNVERPWKLGAGRPFYRVDLKDAGHQVFTDVCFYQSDMPKLPNVPKALMDVVNEQAVEGCAPGLIDITRGQMLANTYVISFLEKELAGAKGYDEVLTPAGAKQFPEVKLSVKTP